MMNLMNMESGARPGYYVGGSLSPSRGEHGSVSLYRESGGGAHSEGPGAEPPEVEAESSVAFESPAKEPNLTLVTNSFC